MPAASKWEEGSDDGQIVEALDMRDTAMADARRPSDLGNRMSDADVSSPFCRPHTLSRLDSLGIPQNQFLPGAKEFDPETTTRVSRERWQRTSA